MALGKAIPGLLLVLKLVVGCDCREPEDLCARIRPNMVAFIGRPISTVPLDPEHQKTTFHIEERLWGDLPAADLIAISMRNIRLPGGNPTRPLFVLAGRLTEPGNPLKRYYMGSFCCSYGLLLPLDHAWVKEFRENVRQRKMAVASVRVWSGGVRLTGLDHQLTGPRYSQRGISNDATISLQVPPDDYKLAIQKPFLQMGVEEDISLLPGACSIWNINAKPSSAIEGTIVKSRDSSSQELYYTLEGEAELDVSPLESAVRAFRRAWHGLVGWGAVPPVTAHYILSTDSNGKFQAQILPGRYRLIAHSRDKHAYVFPPPIPPTYYPGVIEKAKSTEIVVPLNGRIANIDFRLPQYGPTRRVEVFLVHADGSPSRNQVVAHTGTYPGASYPPIAAWTQKLTDEEGRATFEVWQSLDYKLHMPGFFYSKSPTFRAGTESLTLRFVENKKLR